MTKQSIKLSVRLRPTQLTTLQNEANRQGVALSKLVRKALMIYLLAAQNSCNGDLSETE